MATKARNIADLGSNDVIETTATGVDVTGTVTADGLTVDGDTQVNGELEVIDSGTYQLHLASSTGAYSNGGLFLGSDEGGDPYYYGTVKWVQDDVSLKIASQHGNNAGGMFFQTGASTGSPSNRIKIAPDGDVSFYEDTGTTAKFVWDSSAETVSIGGSTSNTKLSIVNDASVNGKWLCFDDTRSGYGDWTFYKTSSNDLSLGYDTNSGASPTQGVTFAYGGNVGIGTSSPISKVTSTGGYLATGLDTPSNTNTGSVQLGYDTNKAVLRSFNSSPIEYSCYGEHKFITNGSERARITSEGTFDLVYKNLGSIATYTDTTYRHRDTFANLYFSTPADNVWRNVCAMDNSYGTFTVTGTDTSSGDVAQYAYRVTTTAYGVNMFSQVFYKEGGWNAGTFEFRIANVGGTQTLQMRYSSYYSSSNTGAFYINFNSLGY